MSSGERWLRVRRGAEAPDELDEEPDAVSGGALADVVRPGDVVGDAGDVEVGPGRLAGEVVQELGGR